jgi:hypothetical protein
MHKQAVAFFFLLMCCVVAAGKDKKKILLPADVLEAQTVMVVIDPEAGVALDSPNANRMAREDVERALMKWGRFSMAIDLAHADLVIMVHKGNGKIAQPTIGGIPNDRPVIFQPTDSGGRIGGTRGTPPPMAGDPSSSQRSNRGSQVEIGQADDLFAVYRGDRADPLDSPAVWRYSSKDALRSPGVPAVDAFRKVVKEAEKQLQAATP